MIRLIRARVAFEGVWRGLKRFWGVILNRNEEVLYFFLSFRDTTTDSCSCRVWRGLKRFCRVILNRNEKVLYFFLSFRVMTTDSCLFFGFEEGFLGLILNQNEEMYFFFLSFRDTTIDLCSCRVWRGLKGFWEVILNSNEDVLYFSFSLFVLRRLIRTRVKFERVLRG